MSAAGKPALPGRWADLLPRIASALVLVAVAGVEVWLGGITFELFIAAICGAMIWELTRMLAPEARGAALQLALLSAAAVFGASFLGPMTALPILLAPAAVGGSMIAAQRRLFVLFCAWITLAGYGFHLVRAGLGIDWMLWLIGVVVATDVAGYFAGKAIGGPKFWPRVSPKKTWSGTIAGWLAAAMVGLAFAIYSEGYTVLLILGSVLAAIFAQAGDIAESALKRRMGVKDSSRLIPGHGGFMDRFDGMMGAAVFMLLAVLLVLVPAAGM